MTFKYFLVAVLIGFIFYLLLLPRVGILRKGVIFAGRDDDAGVRDPARLVDQRGAKRSASLAGVDLLFYLSHLTLFFIAFVYFLKFKEMEVRFTKLVRQLALDRARASPH